MSPEQQQQQKEFVFNPDMSRKSKRQQNRFLKEKGEAERQSIEHFNEHFSKLGDTSPSPSGELEAQTDENAYNFLYPTLDDPEFNIKIASKKEFADTQYDGTVLDSLEAIKNFETLNKLSFLVDKKLMALNRRIEKEAKEIQLKYDDDLMKKQKIENEKKEHDRRLNNILLLFYPRFF
jgi:hypothetical protein